MDDKEFRHWYYKEASWEDRALHDKLYDFDELFDDMRFEQGTAPYALIRCQAKDSDEWVDEEVPSPEDLKCFSYNQIKTKVEKPDYGLGFYDSREKLLCLGPDVAEDDAVLVHEMTHMHEDLINSLPLFYHDTLLWSLYTDLREKIDKLDDAISQHAHLLNETDIYATGGLHDTLFLLKSFDLDIRMGYKLGTVLHYDWAEHFDYLSYKGKPSDEEEGDA